MHETLPITVPRFARLEDFLGEWGYEPARFAGMWRAISASDLHVHLAAGPPPKTPGLTEMVEARGGNIAVIKATGTLMKPQSSFGGTSTIQLRRELRAAASDPTVKGILLAVDSPGGTIAGTEALAKDIRAAAKAKPVRGFIDDLGASAAYWLLSQTDRIDANSQTALVGSIGTILTVYDSSAAFEREGVKTLVYATGPVKGAGTPGTPVTEDHSAYFQGVVNGLQGHFGAAVRSGRGMNAKELATVSTGGVFNAADALDLKLIDGIKGIDQVISEMAAAK